MYASPTNSSWQISTLLVGHAHSYPTCVGCVSNAGDIHPCHGDEFFDLRMCHFFERGRCLKANESLCETVGGRMPKTILIAKNTPQPPMVPVSQKNDECVLESWSLCFSLSFLCLLLCYMVFQFQIVLLLWGIFSQTDESSCFPCARFSEKMGLHRCRASVAIMHMAHKTWGSQSPRQEFFVFFEILEEGRIHVSFIHIKTYKVEV